MRLKVCIFALLGIFTVLSLSCAQEQQPAQKSGKTKVLLLISEQNIEGPQKAWWMSEIDLSTVESAVAKRLIASGYEILDPSVMNRVIKADKAFRRADLPDEETIRLGKKSAADYVVLGKAVASAGGSGVAGSNMRSCFANATVKLIRVQDAKVIAYFDAQGSTIHTDLISGGREALASAGNNLADKIIASLASEASRAQ